MLNAVLSIVSRLTTKEVVEEVAAPIVEPRQVSFGVRLAVLCTDLHEAMQAGKWSEVEYFRKEIDKLMGK